MNKANTKILLAEDDPEISAMLKATLEKRGFEAMTCENGLAAVRLAMEYKPDIILSDLIMPYSDGYEAVAALKRSPTTAGIPVILITGMAEDRERGLRAGADGFLTKPVKSEELIALIEKLTGR